MLGGKLRYIFVGKYKVDISDRKQQQPPLSNSERLLSIQVLKDCDKCSPSLQA
jgi:hypothetical protein